MGAPCNWELNTSCCPGWDDYDPAIQQAATAFATEVLWALSGRQFGPCPTVVRPCMRCVDQTYRTYGVWMDGYSNGAVGPMWWPYIDSGGVWRNCGCAGTCCCVPSSEVWLPGPVPVGGVTEVRVNNAVVDPAQYRLEVGQDGLIWLVAQNGRVWPECQDFNQPASSATDTFVVTYQRGIPVPVGGQLAGGLLACEYAKLCTGAACALSPAATTITREGVTFEVLTASDLTQKGLTPMPQVNQWILSVNPHLRPERPRLWSPDLDSPRVPV